jgi:hypothetical protein
VAAKREALRSLLHKKINKIKKKYLKNAAFLKRIFLKGGCVAREQILPSYQEEGATQSPCNTTY